MKIFEYQSIGTHLKIFLQTTKNCEHIFSQIIHFLDDFDENYSRFREGNWLFHLNRTKKSNFCDTHGFFMLQKMQEISQLSDGFFDPTVWKRLKELGYANKNFSFSQTDFSHKNFDDIIAFNETSVTLFDDTELEFGGVGKWYAIDVIVKILQNSLENENFLINFGGDMAARGSWKIALESPFRDGEAIGEMVLEDAFLACSSPARRKWKNHHHLIDPFSRESATEIVAAFMETPLQTHFWGMHTDGFATAFSVMPWDFACKKFLIIPNLNGVLVRKTGEFFQTKKSQIQLFS